MTLFFDRTMGKKIKEALDLLGLRVEHHDDHFSPLTPDETWLRRAGSNGWLAITHDARIEKRQSALKALADHRAGCFVIRGGANKPSWFTVRVIAYNWDHMLRLASSERRPFLFRLYLRQAPLRRPFPSASA